jgi:acyl dehydratase
MTTTTQPDQVYFEDVQEGMELPSKTKGPLTVTDLVRFSGASGDYSKIHHDREYAKTVAGLPDIILHGQCKLAFMVHVVTDWIGVLGRIRKIGGQYRGMDVVGDTVTSGGRVVRKYAERGENLVELELWNVNGRTGETTVKGTATVSLPSRSMGG